MKKTLIVIMVLTMCLVLFASCAGQQEQAAGGERVMTDQLGNEVTLPAVDEIERVAVLTSPQVQIIYIVGAQENLCAMTNSQKRYSLFEKIYPEQANVPAVRSTAGNINIEELLASDPQFCIGSETDMEVVRAATSIPTVSIDTHEDPDKVFEARKAEVNLFGQLFGAEERAQRYCDYLDATLAKIANTDKGDIVLSAYLGFGDDHLQTYGGNTFMQYQIEAGGLTNAASDVIVEGGEEGGLSNVSLEQIIEWDPDILVFDSGNLEKLQTDPVWSQLSAVKNGNVYMLPVGGFIWNRPSCESAVLLPIWLSMIAYPEAYPDSTVEQEIYDYWKIVLDIDLSDEEIHDILY